MDSTLSALWVIYKRFEDNVERKQLMEDEYPVLVSVFDDLYNQRVHNIQAKEKFKSIFQIGDERYKEGQFVELGLFHDYIQKELYLLQPDKNCSTFHWTYKVVWVCQSCEAKDEDEKVNVRNNVTVEIRNCQTTVQGSLDAFLSGSIRKKFCPECYRETKISRKTIMHPNVLHLTYLSNGLNGELHLPDFLEKVLIIDGEFYDIVGASYGNGLHFIFRYYCDGKVFEADGMVEHPTSTMRRKRRAALSWEIKEPYEIALAGHINYTIGKNKIKIGGTKIIDVYYTMR
jgi:hypothetical protein